VSLFIHYAVINSYRFSAIDILHQKAMNCHTRIFASGITKTFTAHVHGTLFCHVRTATPLVKVHRHYTQFVIILTSSGSICGQRVRFRFQGLPCCICGRQSGSDKFTPITSVLPLLVLILPMFRIHKYASAFDAVYSEFWQRY